jgi:fatty acid amide hydrolase 2
MDPLLRASATRLATLVRDRVVTSREVVEAHIAQIERANPTIRAVVRTRYDEARREARLADERIAADEPAGLPPFHGVPCTIKECFALTGMPNSGGLVARKDVVATTDATAVARLRAAGAIPLGVTNLSELCMWMESNNNVYGRSNNPYDPSRIVGGSSGGEGAIVGAGASPFGLGSDIGGSIRMPAFFNGVFGHKPTGTMVPGSGQYPLAHGTGLRLLTTGPIARRAEDLMPVLRVLAGPDGVDRECRAFTLGDPATVDLSTLTVTSIEHNGFSRVSDDLLAAQRRVADHLRSLGAQVRTAHLPQLRASLEIWAALMSAAGGPTYAELLGNGTAVRPGRELLRWITGRSPYTLPSIGLALIESYPKLGAKRAARAVELAAELKQELVTLIGAHGVMLYPSYPMAAPRHVRPFLPPIQWTYTALINAMELPATQVPLGLDDEGLPLGVQIVGVHGEDHRTIAVALELERAFGGWVPPKRFDVDAWHRTPIAAG